MTTGTVKWFNPTKGYGFIEPEDGSKDAFVHISAVERAGLRTLNEGQKVSYELQTGQNGKTSADNLSVIDEQKSQPPSSSNEGGNIVRLMVRKTNYSFERHEREKAKAAKKAARIEAKREKAASKKNHPAEDRNDDSSKDPLEL